MFKGYCADGYHIRVPPTFYETLDAFLDKWDARYAYPNETNLPDIILAHILSEWYKTRVLSGPDGYYVIILGVMVIETLMNIFKRILIHRLQRVSDKDRHLSEHTLPN